MQIGTHLIIDVEDGQNLNNLDAITAALLAAASAIGATVLDINTHCFEPNGGVTGVVLLAESHISIHTWPEHNFAAIDIFVCGKLDPTNTIDIFQQAFGSTNFKITKIKRGSINE